MRPFGRIPDEAYRALDLRAHALLHDAPLHDAWEIHLPGGGPGRTLADVRPLLSVEDVAASHRFVGFLFALRSWLGRLFRWDAPGESPPASPSAYLERVAPETRQRSDPPPGTPDGPFTQLYALPHESVSEIRNATVHAFLVLSLEEAPDGYRAVWAVHVAPVGGITRLYMALIDPFRHHFVYPAILGHVHRRWRELFGGDASGAAHTGG